MSSYKLLDNTNDMIDRIESIDRDLAMLDALAHDDGCAVCGASIMEPFYTVEGQLVCFDCYKHGNW